MKKTFALTHPKIKRARLVDAVKHDIKKYQARERRKALPSGASFWDFECKFGYAEDTAQSVHPGALKELIDKAEESDSESIYIEMHAKAVLANQNGE